MKDAIGILIPAYNESATIRSLIEGCLRYTDQILVVDDGSTDDTAAIVESLPVTLIKHQQNAGKGGALRTGFHYWLEKSVIGVITLDADAQHDPNDLPRFFESIEKAPNDLLIGARSIDTQNAPKGRLVANKIADFFISWAAGKRVQDTQSGFRYYPAAFLQQFLLQKKLPRRFAFEVSALIVALQKGCNVHYLSIRSCYPDTARKSHYLPAKDTWLIISFVARIILKKGFYLSGLWRVMRSR